MYVAHFLLVALHPGGRLPVEGCHFSHSAPEWCYTRALWEKDGWPSIAKEELFCRRHCQQQQLFKKWTKTDDQDKPYRDLRWPVQM